MKLLLAADGYVGLEITRWLIEHHRDDIALVVTVDKNEIGRLAVGAGVDWAIVMSTRQMAIAFDLGIMAWWPYIIHEPLLSFPKHGWINTHPSLLPHGRGKHPYFWALVEEAPFGVTLHKVAKEVDAGDIVVQEEISYDWTDTGETLYAKAQEAMIELFKSRYPFIRELPFPAWAQEPSPLNLAKHLDGASYIDLDEEYSARDLLNLLRARTFPEGPACWFEDNGAKYDVRIQITRRPEK